MSTQRIKLVVVNEHTLGYILPDMPDYTCLLHTSVLKGSTYDYWASSVYTKNEKVRLASEKDFEDFRVVFGRFGNKELYEFDS